MLHPRPKMTHMPNLITIFALFLAATFTASTVSAADDRWSVHNESNTSTPDYGPLDIFFGGYAEKKGSRTTFAYQSMGARGAKFLNEYVAYLQAIPVSQLSRNQQLAYWLNLHNAAAMRETLSAYPMRRVEALVTNPNSAWSRKSLTVEGVSLSLDEIERDILLIQWKDPRVIYGIYLPAKSAPPLPARAFKGESVFESLEKSARSYINGRAAVTKANNTPKVSLIYQRYADVFDREDAKVIAHLQAFAKSRLAKRIADATNISDYSFDWALNEHKPRQTTGGSSFGGGGISRGGGGFGS